MSYEILQASDGRIRHVEIGEPYRLEPGERQVGVVMDGPATLKASARQTDYTELRQELDKSIGSGKGDWIKVLAKPLAGLMGKKNCTMCEAKRIATNAYAKLKPKYGKVEALRIMAELWLMTRTASPNDVLVKLKGYLND